MNNDVASNKPRLHLACASGWSSGTFCAVAPDDRERLLVNYERAIRAKHCSVMSGNAPPSLSDRWSVCDSRCLS